MAINKRELERYIDYNPNTGDFTWKYHWFNKKLKGKPAGHVSKHDKYQYITLNYVKYKASDIAFILMGRPIPKKVIYIDNDKSNNKWDNLMAYD